MNQLEVLRESLGQCDEIILDALLMRNRIVEDIMVYKEANDLPVLQPEQEAKQKGWLEARMEGRRHKKEVNDVFASITQNSKRIQSRNLFNYNIFLIGFMGAEAASWCISACKRRSIPEQDEKSSSGGSSRTRHHQS